MSYVNDPVYWALRQLRGKRANEAIADAWTRWSGSRPVVVTAKPVWTSYRPFRKARVVLQTKIVPTDGIAREMSILFSARASDSAFKNELANTPALDRPRGVLPPFAIEPWRTAAWVLPHAPRPAALAQLMRKETIESMLPGAEPAPVESIEVQRYVPMRRALLRFFAGGKQYFAKTFDKAENYRQSAAALEYVADLPIRVPRVVALAPKMNALLMDSLPGSPLSDYLLAGPLRPLADAGSVLASFHQRSPVPDNLRSSGAELEDIEQLLLADLALARPRLAERVGNLLHTLATRLNELGEADPVAIHGSLFGDQILFDPAEKHSISIVDWDDLAGGDAHFDLGRLIAHLLFESSMAAESNPGIRAEAFINGYRNAGGTVDTERLRWHVAAALLLRAKISLLRTLTPGWESAFDAIIDRVESMLADRPFFVGSMTRRAG